MKTVKTDSARTQNLAANSSKLAGQCGKLKCCLNYELDTYLEAWEHFPSELLELESDRGVLVPLQPDVLKGVVYYSLPENTDKTRFEIPVETVKALISLNKNGKLVQTSRLDSTKTSVKNNQNVFN